MGYFFMKLNSKYVELLNLDLEYDIQYMLKSEFFHLLL